MPASTIQDVRLDLIDPDPSQPRKSHDPEALQRLADTIKSNGVEQPIRVRPSNDRWVIVHGERRWRAAMLAGLEAVPCIVEVAQESKSNLRLRQLTENCAREELAPLELAAAIELSISEDGLTAAQVAQVVGLSEGHVSKLRVIRKASADIQQGVQRGELSIAAAYELAKASDSLEQQANTAGQSPVRLSQGALVRKLKRVRRSESAPERGSTRITAALGGGRSVTVAGRGLSWEGLIESLEQLLSRAKKSKSQGLSLATFVRTLRDQAAS